ncbi:TetR/AcrR family transcriptional regulator [Symbioplanes lichenis]|uniref:TetR/AcrR family transcriptional regulator n=1 Tax=Symbioplanes lichenis TaxID=1629072 RepID=UPI00273A2958|nr:TetR/AcrR family transcriptional regulator C-terminal ligand-binding domain-containing protein [Actinoplanes lichenis]
MTETPGSRRPGGRTSKTRAAVHAAVRELLVAHDGALPTMADVATASGVHLATLYRRWRTPQTLVLDVAIDDLNDRQPIGASGDLRKDLLAYTVRLADWVASPGGPAFLRTIIAAASSSEAAAGTTLELINRRLDGFQRILDAAGATELTPLDVVDLLLAPVYLRALMSQPLAADGPEPERLVANVLAVLDARRRSETPEPERAER